MYCDACGQRIRDEQRYCGACGRPIIPLPFGHPQSAGGRVRRHIQLVGFLTIVGSIIGLLWGFFLLHAGHGPFGHPFGQSFGHWHRPFHLFWFPHTFGMWVFCCAIAGLIAGWGLLQRQPWARSLALLMNSLALVYVPFGTMLGLYTLWVLLPRESEREYRRIAH